MQQEFLSEWVTHIPDMHLVLSSLIVHPELQDLHRCAPLTGQYAPVSATPFLHTHVLATQRHGKLVRDGTFGGGKPQFVRTQDIRTNTTRSVAVDRPSRLA